MSQKERLKGARIVNELLEDAVTRKNKKIVSANWLPDPEFEPSKVDSTSYMLVVNLGKEKIDLGFSINDLEEIPTDSFIRHSTERYIDILLSKL